MTKNQKKHFSEMPDSIDRNATRSHGKTLFGFEVVLDERLGENEFYIIPPPGEIERYRKFREQLESDPFWGVVPASTGNQTDGMEESDVL